MDVFQHKELTESLVLNNTIKLLWLHPFHMIPLEKKKHTRV